MGSPTRTTTEFVLKQGELVTAWYFVTAPMTLIPLHLHRHQFELVEMNGSENRRASLKTRWWFRITAAPRSGLSSLTSLACPLFHCHIQQHMDYGFKALFRYA